MWRTSLDWAAEPSVRDVEAASNVKSMAQHGEVEVSVEETDRDVELQTFWDEIQTETEAEDYYFRTTEFEDLCDIVRSAGVLARALSDSERHVRCILTELTNALGIAMICALRRTDGGGIWRRDDEVRLLKHNNDHDSAYPNGMKIASPRELWRRVKSENSMANWGGKPLSTNERREELLNFVFVLRDEFQHFSPKSWSISRTDTIDSIQELLVLLRELIVHPSYSHRLCADRRTELTENLNLIDKNVRILGDGSSAE